MPSTCSTYRKLVFPLLVFISQMSTVTLYTQVVPTHEVIKVEKLVDFLKPAVKKRVAKEGPITQHLLATYLKDQFATRYFFDWKNVDARFEAYKKIYNKKSRHQKRAEYHMQKYADSTLWKLPFNDQHGDPVNAYALRHLARQHKMVDVAFHYFYDDKDPKYIHYFTRQMRSLNAALHHDTYEKIKDGNGVYEAFRSGYRVLNWLEIHNLFLGQSTYTDHDQLVTIASLLQHGAHLYAKNQKFKFGNHQTRGVSALAMLSILLRDFEGTDQWYSTAMTRLEEHLSKEVNPDGFQFERSVHYHMSDINNYFYVYQLSKLSGIPVPRLLEEKLHSLFTTLAKIAYPDKSAPVLQDDTEIPWSNRNEISNPMTLGYLLFGTPELGYFAKEKLHYKSYWFLRQEQLALLDSIQKEKPTYGSLSFPETGYYVMRAGWNPDDAMMIISAGVDPDKPDHQHGDVLGVQAIANNHVILPNYQVRYPVDDLYFFKNSMVKNVALVDEELQGKKWTGNKGGSGFGKFKQLPTPKAIAWQTNNTFDFFAGKHDGFETLGISYSRQVLFIEKGFWIVKDNFLSKNPHHYKQIWQGDYKTVKGSNLIRSRFDATTGCDIYQFHSTDHVITDGRREKKWAIVHAPYQKKFSFITAIVPFKAGSSGIDETLNHPTIRGWNTINLPYQAFGNELHYMHKGNETYLFNTSKISIDNIQISFAGTADLYIKKENNTLTVHSLSDQEHAITIKGKVTAKIEDLTIRKQGLLKPMGILRCTLR